MTTRAEKIRILAEESIPYLRGNLEKMGDVVYLPSSDFTPETVRHADWLIIRSITRITPELLEESHVRLITTATIGYDHIDTAYCDRHGIAWRNAPGCNAGGVGQYFASYVSFLALRGDLKPEEMTIGIVGAGHTGSEAKKYAEAFGMRVLLCDPPRADREGHEGFVSMDEIAREADLIEFHVPMTYSGPYPTYHLLGDELLTKLEKKPLIANLCRGPVTDTAALLRGLKEGRISRVVIDCWEGEPNISEELLAAASVATPHIAGFSAEGKRRGAMMCMQNGADFFGLEMPVIEEPPSPTSPLIDLTHVSGRNQIYHALLHTFDPQVPDHALRENPEDFEKLRKNYSYPREAPAYSVVGASPGNATILSGLGFKVI